MCYSVSWDDTIVLNITIAILKMKHELTYYTDSTYLCASFGNETRIDYGTGHEKNFVVVLFCLFCLQIIKPEQLRQLMSSVFREYIKAMRRLQEVYMLEPAGHF